MIKGAAAVITLLALALAAAGCGPDAIPDDEASQPFEGTAVTTGAGGGVLVVGVRGPDSDRGCQQSLAVARLDAEGRTAGRAGVAAGSIDDSCLPKVERVVNDRQGRLVVYGSSFDVGFLGDSEPGPSVLLGFEPSGRLDPGLGDGGVIVDPELQTPFAALPDGRLVDFSGTIVDGSETERDGLDPPEVGGGPFPDEMAGLEDGLALAWSGFEIARLDESGELTPGYGLDGVTSLDGVASLAVGGEESLEALIPSGDGAMVVLTALSTPLARASYRSVLRRVTPGGDQDGDFGTRGRLDLASALGEDFFLGAVEALPDGRLVSIGAERRTGRVVVARFGAAGRLDGGFGRRGVRRLDLGVTPLSANAEPEIDLAVARDGSITGLVGGGFETPTRLIRLGPEGALDRRFGSGGVRLLESL